MKHVFAITGLALTLACYTGCIAVPKISPQVQIQKAEHFLEKGEFHKALDELNQLVIHDPNNIKAHLDRAWAFYYIDDNQGVTKELALLEEKGATPDELAYLKGKLLAKLEEWVEALTWYNKALEKDPNNADLHYDIATTFLALNESEAALREMQQAIKLEPKNNMFLFGECKTYRQLQKYEAALKSCRLAWTVTKDPEEQVAIESVIQNIQLVQQLETADAPKNPS